MPRMGDLAATDVYSAFDVPGEQTYDRRLDQTWPGRLAQEAIGAVLAPGRALQSTEPITTEQMIKPAVDLAGLVTGGSYAAPAQRGASGAGIRAYHSSPHDFDKFDLAKIGTGEGAQVYGHGLYFAENPAVSGQGGQYWQQFLNRFEGTPEGHAASRLRSVNWDRAKALRETERDATDWEKILSEARPDQTKYFTQMRDLRQREAELLASDKPVGPRTYEVNINADPAHMLDWDKPIHQQPRKAMDVLYPGVNPAELDLNDFRNALRMETSAKDLREAGIPGIKYLDQGSRMPGPSAMTTQQLQDRLNIMRADLASGRGSQSFLERQISSIENELERFHQKPTSNYVIFDPGIIDIMKKYGIAGAAPVGMGALAAQDRYQQ